MDESTLVSGFEAILGAFAAIAIILTGLGTIAGLVKPSDAVKYCGVIAGLVIVLVLFVSVFVGLWSSMTLWQRILLAAILCSVFVLRRERRRSRRNGDPE